MTTDLCQIYRMTHFEWITFRVYSNTWNEVFVGIVVTVAGRIHNEPGSQPSSNLGFVQTFFK